MSPNQVNKQELATVAQDLLHLLEKYQASNEAAKNILGRMRILINKAINMEIEEPLPRGFLPGEFREYELKGLPGLEIAIVNFHELLRGAKSIDQDREVLQRIMKQADIDEQEFREKWKRDRE
jgi:hypothetical protein